MEHRRSEFRLRTFRFQPFRLLVPKSLQPCPCFLYPRTVPPPSTLAFASSVQARRLHSPPRRFPGGLCYEAATFALCYGPVSCSLFTDKSFYFRAFAPWSHLPRASNITIRPNSQLPEPDFHRQDTQHYGLRAEDAQKITRNQKAKGKRQKERKGNFVLWVLILMHNFLWLSATSARSP